MDDSHKPNADFKKKKNQVTEHIQDDTIYTNFKNIQNYKYIEMHYVVKLISFSKKGNDKHDSK